MTHVPTIQFPEQIFVNQDSQQQGPFTIEEVNAKIRACELTGVNTFAWYQGCSQWIRIDQVPGVFMLNTPPTFIAGAMPSSQSDATAGLIPYKNPYALVGYYLSIFSMIPFVGIFLGVAGIICGIVGVRRRNRNPIMRGTAHAWFAILFSALVILIQVALVIYLSMHKNSF
jgi:hypothetical protein